MSEPNQPTASEQISITRDELAKEISQNYDLKAAVEASDKRIVALRNVLVGVEAGQRRVLEELEQQAKEEDKPH